MQLDFSKKTKEQPSIEQTPVVNVEAPEAVAEQSERSAERTPEDTSRDQAELARRIQQQAVPRPISRPPKTHLRRELEMVLAEDVFDFMKQASPTQQLEIRRRGREVLDQIETMIRQTKINVRKIIQLILSWLKLLPISNKYFLEQEAKIKAEEILRIAAENQRKM